MFVTLKVFKLIGPSNDCRRHGRGTYLLYTGSLNNIEGMSGGGGHVPCWYCHGAHRRDACASFKKATSGPLARGGRPGRATRAAKARVSLRARARAPAAAMLTRGSVTSPLTAPRCLTTPSLITTAASPNLCREKIKSGGMPA
jgi:hypothetical protein